MDILHTLKIKIQEGVITPTHHHSTHIVDTLNPTTGQTIARVKSCSEKDLAETVERARHAFETWRNVPAPKRGELVRAIGEALRHHKKELGHLISLECGKIRAEGEGEVQEMIDMADFAVGQSRMLYGKSMHSERPHHRLYEQWHPLGPVAVITAFNFPMAVWSWNAFIAAICGDTVIWKPSSKVPLCAIAVQAICDEVCQKMELENIFQLLISDDNTLITHFIENEHIPLVSFTGSVPVGRMVAEKVAQRFGHSLLELSGNNAVIVDETAELSLAIPAIVFGAVGTAGQRCTSTRRLFVHRTRLGETIEKLIDAYKKVRIGDPLHADTLMGPLIDERAVKHFTNAIKQLRELNAEILFGGNVLSGAGFFVEPTLVLADNNWDIVKQETFAPILYVMPFDTLEEAIAMQNAVPQGLSSSLFTQRVSHAELFLSAMGSDCGIANINVGTSGAEIGGAFGGEKETGGGREAGSDAWKAYMRRQTNTINWGMDLPLAQGISFL